MGLTRMLYKCTLKPVHVFCIQYSIDFNLDGEEGDEGEADDAGLDKGIGFLWASPRCCTSVH